MRLIDAETLFDKVGNIKPRSQRQYDDIGNFMNMITNSPTVNAVPLSVIEDIKVEIQGNMESIIGKYDSSIPKAEMPSYKLERNSARRECIDIIDKHVSPAGAERSNKECI